MLSTKAKLQKSADFTFAVGKIRVWESKLLEESIFYQLVDSPNPQSMESVLNATEYGKEISISNFDKDIDKKEISTLYEIKALVKDSSFILPFFYKRDFHNLKLIAKSKFVKVKEEWIKESLIRKEIISKVLAENNSSYLPETYSNFVDEAWALYDKTNQWQLMDALLDKQLYEEILNVTQRKELSFANQFFKMEIDLLNIKIFIRCKNQEVGTDLFLQLLIDGGLLGKKFLGKLYEQSVDNVADRLKFTPYYILSSEEIPFLKEKGEFYKIEQGSCSVLLNYLSCARYTAFGYEPVLRYLFLKMNEFRNLRAVFAGKLHGAGPEKIKEIIGPFSS